ncbi:MAG: hypothetical protein BEN19_05080 [Epulopiscium sp. Nuni2H_MBin003]|nr:MAG: hypothetical protein BEN19_05080 [Epulopiscium sp. Nuni2H_MBin003]
MISTMNSFVTSIIADFVPFIIHSIELMGIIILTGGTLRAFFHYVKSLLMKDDFALKYQLANSMAIALEFKLAAEILKTVVVRDLEEILILAAVVSLRVVMTFIIRMEMKEAEESIIKETEEITIKEVTHPIKETKMLGL